MGDGDVGGSGPIAALAVGGFDPTGTAGVAVDLRVLAGAGLHGAAVLTVVTAQTTASFGAASGVSAALVDAQLAGAVDDLAPSATKLGMLWSGEIASVVLDRVTGLPALVVDPVLVDGSGARIVDASVDPVLRRLLAHAAVVTPNRAEAGLLLGRSVTSVDDAREAAVELAGLGPGAVVVTAGGQSPDAIDVVVTAAGVRELTAARLGDRALRGSGDALSAAITAGLALGVVVDDAIDAAHRVTQLAIARGLRSSPGRGRPSVRIEASDWASTTPQVP